MKCGVVVYNSGMAKRKVLTPANRRKIKRKGEDIALNIFDGVNEGVITGSEITTLLGLAFGAPVTVQGVAEQFKEKRVVRKAKSKAVRKRISTKRKLEDAKPKRKSSGKKATRKVSAV